MPRLAALAPVLPLLLAAGLQAAVQPTPPPAQAEPAKAASPDIPGGSRGIRNPSRPAEVVLRNGLTVRGHPGAAVFDVKVAPDSTATLRDLVQAVEQIGGAPMNLLGMPGPDPVRPDAIPLPQIDLRSVSVPLAVETLVDLINAADPAKSPIVVDTLGGGGNGTVLRLSRPSSAAASRQPLTRYYPVQAMVAQLAVLADNDRAAAEKTLLSSIENGMRLSGLTPDPELMFQADAGLIIARGSAAQHQIIENALAALGQSGQTASVVLARRKEAASIRDRLAEAAIRRDMLAKERDTTKLQYDAGRIPVGDLNRAESQLQMAEGMIEELKRKSQSLEAEPLVPVPNTSSNDEVLKRLRDLEARLDQVLRDRAK